MGVSGAEGTIQRTFSLEGKSKIRTDVFLVKERVKGFEPSTSCLGSKHSAAELHPLAPAILCPAASLMSSRFKTAPRICYIYLSAKVKDE
jgi:hypothetical protein